MHAILCITIGIGIFVAFYQTGRYFEKREWNGGTCPKCGKLWERFDTDSQGGRGYKCPCPQNIWISYPGVDKRK